MNRRKLKILKINLLLNKNSKPESFLVEINCPSAAMINS